MLPREAASAPEDLGPGSGPKQLTGTSASCAR